MSDRENVFRFIPALQLTVSVKILGDFLREPKYKEMMKKAAWDSRPDEGGMYWQKETELEFSTEKLEMRVERLPLSGLLITNLKRLLVLMIKSAGHWLTYVALHTPSRWEKKYWDKTIYGLIGHLQWDNIGCLDGRKTLDSYVKNRENIDFVIWNQLCFHCMEEDIRKFSKTLDLKKCKRSFESVFSVYWYRKIYGQLPRKKMYSLHFYDVDDPELDEEEILRAMFGGEWDYETSRDTGMTTSAIMYFRNYLKDDSEFLNLVSHTFWNLLTDDVVLYLLRLLEGNTLFDLVANINAVANCLTRIPVILYIDYWIRLFETVHSELITSFFVYIGNPIRTKGINDNETLYEPFEEAWRIYYRRFSSDCEKIGAAFLYIIKNQNIRVLKLMFKDMQDYQRIYLLKALRDYVAPRKSMDIYRVKAAEFSKKVLKNDEERKLFSEVRTGPSLWEQLQQLIAERGE